MSTPKIIRTRRGRGVNPNLLSAHERKKLLAEAAPKPQEYVRSLKRWFVFQVRDHETGSKREVKVERTREGEDCLLAFQGLYALPRRPLPGDAAKRTPRFIVLRSELPATPSLMLFQGFQAFEAEVDGRVLRESRKYCGAFDLFYASSNHRQEVFELHLSHRLVDETMRGLGLGNLLADRLEKSGYAAGSRQVKVFVDPEAEDDQDAVIRLFERRGYSKKVGGDGVVTLSRRLHAAPEYLNNLKFHAFPLGGGKRGWHHERIDSAQLE